MFNSALEAWFLTGVYVFDARLQILVSVQVDGNERGVFAEYIAGFAGVDGVYLVLPAGSCGGKTTVLKYYKTKFD